MAALHSFERGAREHSASFCDICFVAEAGLWMGLSSTSPLEIFHVTACARDGRADSVMLCDNFAHGSFGSK